MNVVTSAKEVSVFRSGCTVKTYGTAELSETSAHLCIEGLSAGAVSDSVRVLLGEGLKGSNVQVRYLSDEEEDAVFKEIDQKIGRVASRIEACEIREQLWKGNTAFAGSQNFDLNLVKEYAAALPGELEQIFTEKEALTSEKEELLKEREKLEKTSACPRAELDVICEKPGVYPFALEYYEPSASWAPAYEIRAEGEEQPLTVRLRANIRQNSGIDWENVAVSLYTGNPSVSADIPELNELHLSIAQPVRTRNFAGNMMMGAAKMMAVQENAMADTAMMDLSEVQEETAVKEEGETMSEYRLNGTWTIRSGAADEHADLNVHQVTCTYHVVALPGLSNNAYLAAEISTEDIQDIIDCTASLYLNGTYSGDIQIDADLTKKTYDLSLGKDETIRISRTRKKKYTSGILLKGQKKTEYEYEIEAVSAKNKACRLTILDQVPVSDDKTIIVEAGTLSGGTRDERTGEVRWDLELKPGEKTLLELAYSVAWPKDKQIRETVMPSGTGRFCRACGAPITGNLKFCSECGAPV